MDMAGIFALGAATGILVAAFLIFIVANNSNQRQVMRQTHLTPRQRALNRTVARSNWELVRRARLIDVRIQEDPFYTYTNLTFDNGYTLNFAVAHGRTVVTISATLDEELKVGT